MAGLTDSQKKNQDWINNEKSGFGGMDSYINGQQNRYNAAVASGNQSEISKLQSDAARVGYNFKQPASEPDKPAQNQTAVNLSGVYGAVNQYKTPQGPYNMNDMKSAIDAAKVAGSNNVFDLNSLKAAIEAANGAGTNPDVRTSQYSTPEGIGKLITQMNSVLQPLTDAQKASSTAGFNSQMQGNRSRWASRGLLASGAAAAQEGSAANQHAAQLSAIDAANQANAIGHAFNAANLDLAENQQIFNQGANNRDFTANRAQNNVGNLLSGLGAQLNQNQFELGRAQNNVGNVMGALGFEHNVGQDYIGNLMNATNMDIGQRQWGAQFGEGQRQFDTGTALQLAQMFGGFGNAAPNGNTGIAGGGAGGYTAQNLQSMLAPYQGMQTMDAQQFREGQRQFNIGAATDLSQLFGQAVMPKQSGDALFGQVAGKPTFQASSWGQQFAADEKYRQKGLALDWARHNTDSDYKGFLKQQGLTEQQGQMATQGYLTQIMQQKDQSAAKQYIIDHAQDIITDGANVSQILNLFDVLYPQPKTAKPEDKSFLEGFLQQSGK